MLRHISVLFSFLFLSSHILLFLCLFEALISLYFGGCIHLLPSEVSRLRGASLWLYDRCHWPLVYLKDLRSFWLKKRRRQDYLFQVKESTGRDSTGLYTTSNRQKLCDEMATHPGCIPISFPWRVFLRIRSWSTKASLIMMFMWSCE